MHRPRPCACWVPTGGRRAVLTGLAALALTRGARAADPSVSYEAMLLTCIDPRFVDPAAHYMAGRKLDGRYSQFTFAGAAIGVVAPKFVTWHPAFWDNLATSITLHRIRSVVAIDHRDCGAARIAYGANSIATPATESHLHREVAARFRAEVARRHPGFGVETWLMATDGSVENLA